MVSSRKIIKSVLINQHYIHNLPIDVEKIPHFGQKPHYNIVSLLTHVLILLDMSPVNITNMGSTMPLKRIVIVRPLSKKESYDRERMLESFITLLVEPLKNKMLTKKHSRCTYKYSLVDVETGTPLDLFWTHNIENTTTNPSQKKKIARRLALLLGIKRVACIDSKQDMIIDNRVLKKQDPYRFIMRKYPSHISRKIIYVNLIRLLEGVNSNPTLSDKIQ